MNKEKALLLLVYFGWVGLGVIAIQSMLLEFFAIELIPVIAFLVVAYIILLFLWLAERIKNLMLLKGE